MQIKNKVAIVTGGASGLGQATAEALVHAGAKVALFDLNDDLGHAVVQQLGAANALYCRVNVTSDSEVASAIAQVTAKFGAVHVCVNCAGIGGAAKTVIRADDLVYPEL